MTFQQAAQDIRYLLSDFFPTIDTKISLGYALNLINQKRAAIISMKFAKTGFLNTQWLNINPDLESTPVNFQNNINSVAECDCQVGKIEIPQVVELFNPKMSIQDAGVSHIRSTCGVSYSRTNEREFIALWESESPFRKLPYFWHVADEIYFYPFREKVHTRLVLFNPMEGWEVESNYIINGDLIYNTVYKVTSGNITYNSVKYQRGDTFTAVTAGGKSWTGNGKVNFNVNLRKKKWSDQYPIDGETYSLAKNMIREDLQTGKLNMIDVVSDGAVEEGTQRAKA